MLFPRLMFDHDIATSAITTLKTSKLPIVFLGAGRLAQGWISFLKSHGLAPSAVCVTSDYLSPNIMFEGYDVEDLASVLSRYDKVIVVLACANRREKIVDCLYKTGKVDRVVSFGATRSEAMFSWVDLQQHASELEDFYAKLADEKSRDVLVALINSRMTGDKGILDVTDVAGEDQYFPPFVPTSETDVYIDCGAYTGDTFEVFKRHYPGGFCKYVAFECDPANYMRLKTDHADNRLVCIQKGVSDAPGNFRMAADGSSSSSLSITGEIEVELTTLDLTPESQDATIVKMDIEGAECAALRGGGGLIRRNRPILEICIYHKASDIYEIPAIITSLDEGYAFYLRHYQSTVTDEVVLYALPQ